MMMMMMDAADVGDAVKQRRCMLSSQPAALSVQDFLHSVDKKRKKGKFKLEYSVN